MNELTKPQIYWLFGSAVIGIVTLLMVPLVSVSHEISSLGSIEAKDYDTTPFKKRFDVIYWPFSIFFLLVWAVLIIFKAPEEPDIKQAMWKMLGICGVLVFFSYFMQVAGKNYVIEHTDEIQRDKNIQMAAILSTFTLVIYITGSVAAVVTLTANRKDPEEESLLSRLSNKLRKNSEIERWPSKIDRISAMYEKLIEGSARTPSERTRMRKALVASLKKVYTFKEAYHILKTELDNLNLDVRVREAFLVQSTDIIAETDDNPSPSIFRKLIDAVTPGALMAPATGAASTASTTVPEHIDVLTYTGAYFVIEVVDAGQAGREEDFIIPNASPSLTKTYTYNTPKTIEKGKVVEISMIKN